MLVMYDVAVPILRISCRIQETNKAEVCHMKVASHANCTHILISISKKKCLSPCFFGPRRELEECIL